MHAHAHAHAYACTHAHAHAHAHACTHLLDNKVDAICHVFVNHALGKVLHEASPKQERRHKLNPAVGKQRDRHTCSRL